MTLQGGPYWDGRGRRDPELGSWGEFGGWGVGGRKGQRFLCTVQPGKLTFRRNPPRHEEGPALGR